MGGDGVRGQPIAGRCSTLPVELARCREFSFLRTARQRAFPLSVSRNGILFVARGRVAASPRDGR